MKVFISWSGSRSKFLANSLREWLPKVVQSTSLWMSDADIITGARWSAEIAVQLQDTEFGIICATPENQDGTWLNFEAGALSKSVLHSRVIPLLFDLKVSDLQGPISQFQAVQFDEDGIWKLIRAINNQNTDRSLSVEALQEIFEVWWPKLSAKIQAAPLPEISTSARTERDMIDEILSNSREQLRRENERMLETERRTKYINEDMLHGMQQMQSLMDQLMKVNPFVSKNEPDPSDFERVVTQTPSRMAAIMADFAEKKALFDEKEKGFVKKIIEGDEKPV